jgi:hypothetical protein
MQYQTSCAAHFFSLPKSTSRLNRNQRRRSEGREVNGSFVKSAIIECGGAAIRVSTRSILNGSAAKNRSARRKNSLKFAKYEDIAEFLWIA